MVVAIHTHPLYEFNSTLEFIVSEFLPRIAVPFFFCVSGYYSIDKIINNEFNLKRTVLSFLKPYFIWSLIYSSFRMVNDIMDNRLSIKVVVSYVVRFFTIGTETFMWFFPSIIFTTILVFLIFRFRLQKALIPFSILLFILGCVGCSYYQLGIHIPVVKTIITWDYFVDVRRAFLMGIPYYSLGYFVILTKNKISNRSVVVCLFLSFLLEIFEMIIIKHFNLDNSVTMSIAIMPVLYFLFVLFLNKPMYKFAKLSKYSRGLSNFTYYSHSLVILLISIVFDFSGTLLFVIAILVTGFAGFVIIKSENRILKHLMY